MLSNLSVISRPTIRRCIIRVTNYTEQNSYWETYSLTASPESLLSPWNSKVHYLMQSAQQWSPSWVRWIDSTLSQRISIRFVSIICFGQRVVLWSGGIPAGFLTKMLNAFLLRATRLAYLFLFEIITIIFGEEYKSPIFSPYNFLQPSVSSSLQGPLLP
jgi:hypothetical protein